VYQVKHVCLILSRRLSEKNKSAACLSHLDILYTRRSHSGIVILTRSDQQTHNDDIDWTKHGIYRSTVHLSLHFSSLFNVAVGNDLAGISDRGLVARNNNGATRRQKMICVTVLTQYYTAWYTDNQTDLTRAQSTPRYACRALKMTTWFK